ncbi:hypothetical protein [Candidatus Uabimicrobium sp. HlEnr_7]|uniref:hypothetical protein n=1 Tax=Candidatus Uabimicrobium helgolandensis TaxID=3095367 RepID=UPI00355857FC
MMDIVAAIYAWKGNKEKAYLFAKKANPETFKRIELFLQGNSLKQTEKMMRE